MKKTILHIIYNLGRGGAETMLVSVLKELNDYNNIVITLDSTNDFLGELICDKHICLGCSKPWQVPVAIFRLKKIIRTYRPDLVHTHLFWPTLIARLAVPCKIPLITTIHSYVATSIEYKSVAVKLIDQISYRFRKNIIVGVSKGVLDEYFGFLKLIPFKTHVLYTFVDTSKYTFNPPPARLSNAALKVVTVGALREQKNQLFLLKAFNELKNYPIYLDIYGVGPLQNELEGLIKTYQLAHVQLKGQKKNVHEILPCYDLFIMSSTFEGFSLSVLEAMAVGVPVLLSNIASFREQCEATGIYFELENTNSLVERLIKIYRDSSLMNDLSKQGYNRVVSNFTLQRHMNELRSIYQSSLHEP